MMTVPGNFRRAASKVPGAVRVAPTDLKQILHGRRILCAHLESEDDGPDEAEREPGVAVDDIVRPQVLQMDPLLAQELQRLLHILQAVDAHLALGWSRLGKTRRC